MTSSMSDEASDETDKSEALSAMSKLLEEAKSKEAEVAKAKESKEKEAETDEQTAKA